MGGGGAANFGSRVKKGSMSKEQVETTVGLVKGTLDYSDFGTLDLVIEVGGGDWLVGSTGVEWVEGKGR